MINIANSSIFFRKIFSARKISKFRSRFRHLAWDNRKAIRDALMKVKRVGPMGELEFDKNGDVLFTGDVPLKIENGKFVVWKSK